MQPTPFSGGSDHYILSDPTIGVPTPMLMQWPDKYYHTSGDTIDKVSPDVMRRMVTAASTYAYVCARASEEDLVGLVGLTGRGLRKWMIDEIGRFSEAGRRQSVTPEYKARFLLKRGKEALRSIRKLSPGSRALRARIRAEESKLASCVKTEAVKATAGTRHKAPMKISAKLGNRSGTIYRRTLPGPVDIGALLMDLSSRWKSRYRRWLTKESSAYVMQPLTLYWMDGRRTSEEICRLIAAETGRCNPEFLGFNIDLLEEAGVIERVRG
jgi:hypothetical protein